MLPINPQPNSAWERWHHFFIAGIGFLCCGVGAVIAGYLTHDDGERQGGWVVIMLAVPYAFCYHWLRVWIKRRKERRQLKNQLAEGGATLNAFEAMRKFGSLLQGTELVFRGAEALNAPESDGAYN